jgi:hypothetical protein
MSSTRCHYITDVQNRHSSPTADAAANEWVTKITSYVKKSNIERTGISHPTPALIALENDDIKEVYGKNYARLRKLKAKYDPLKVWNKGHIIEPDFD